MRRSQLRARPGETEPPSDGRIAVRLGALSLLGPTGGFVANVVYARSLGASGRGDLAAVIAALAVCEVALVFGLSDVFARHAALGDLGRAVVRRAARLGVTASVVPAVLVAGLAASHQFSGALVILVFLTVPVATLASMARGTLLGTRRFTSLAWSLTLGGFIRLGAPVVLLIADPPTVNLALLLVLSSTWGAALPIFASRPFSVVQGDGGTPFWRILREALSIWPSNLAWSLNSRLDQLLLAAIISPTELGRYAVCVTLAELPVVALGGLRQVILVRIAESGRQGALRFIVGMVVVLGVVLGASAYAGAGRLMTVVFGPDFADTAHVLGLLIGASGFIIAAGLLNSALISLGLGRWTVMSQASGLIVSVTLLCVVMPRGAGIEAAAAISVVTYGCVFAVACLLLFRLAPEENELEEVTR